MSRTVHEDVSEPPESEDVGRGAADLPTMAWWVVGGLAALKLVVQLSFVEGYGIFRDELYYLACTEHLAWGYVDHPSLSILVLWCVKHLLGTSLFALRLLPALAGTATVVLVAATARVLGGGRLAQGLAATAVVIAPHYLAIHHYYSMNAWSVLLWALAAWLMAQIARQASPRLWLSLGGVLALGLANKIDVLWLGAGLGLGLLLATQRRWLATRWPWLTGAVSMLGLAPYALWQVRHGWPTREFIDNATQQKMVAVSPVDFLLSQVDSMHAFTVPVTLAGLAYLLAHREGRKFSVLAWTFLGVLAILMLSGSSRSGYLAPAYTWVFPAGGVAIEALLRRWRAGWAGWVVAVLMLLGGAVVAPFALPILPVTTYLSYAEELGVTPSTEEKKELGALPQFYADMHGWRAIADTVIQVVEALPASERAHARVFAPDYGVAGAIDYFGRPAGLAPALSGHNNYWLWGPGDFDGQVMVVIGGSRENLEQAFEQVEQVSALDCGYCMPYEQGLPVWVCRRLRGNIETLWAQVKHYD